MTKEEVVLPPFAQVIIFRQKLLPWFEYNGRHFPWRASNASNYEKVLSEVFLQRTKAESVAEFFLKFIVSYPSWNRLAQATEEELSEYLKPIGLWRRRSASLSKLAKEMYSRGGKFPRKREEIEKLPGIGQYIANAVLLFCFGEHHPLLDVNMARVLERYFGPRKLADIRYDPYLQALARDVIDCEEAVQLNWAILDLAAVVCKSQRPLCFKCPLYLECKYAHNKE